jgi:UDP-N-acetylmuramate dehydrogenase
MARQTTIEVFGVQVRGQLRLHEPMSRHTSWRVGGPADRFYQPADLDDLIVFLRAVPADEPLAWIGLGSNLLVRDGGVRGTVICTTGRLNRLELLGEDRLRAEAGVTSAKVARFAVEHGLSGVEFLAGIPGTVGGALAMNAGAFGGETWKRVCGVETLDRQGRLRHRQPGEFEVGYRHVRGLAAGEWFAAAHFQLQAGDAQSGKAQIRSLLAKRGDSQPTRLPNAGSVFRNPPGDFSARLIESANLKGRCEGKACVSELHANFIVNTGGATAAEVERLIDVLREEVSRVHGVRLEPEVRIIGEPL